MAAKPRLTLILLGALLAISGGCKPDSQSASGGGGTTEPDVETNPLLAIEETTTVTIAGEEFTVAIAADQDRRIKGLGDVPEIPADRGMLFLFKSPQHMSFVMRDCLVDIDIAYLTGRGTVVRTYTMGTEPRLDGETASAYESRLSRYPSGRPVLMALELRAGTLDRLGVSAGMTLDIEKLDTLKKEAR